MRVNFQQQIDDSVFDYLSRSLTALTAQSHVLGDPAYLWRFPPSQLAAVHSVMADKVARLIEALHEPEHVSEGMAISCQVGGDY